MTKGVSKYYRVCAYILHIPGTIEVCVRVEENESAVCVTILGLSLSVN